MASSHVGGSNVDTYSLLARICPTELRSRRFFGCCPSDTNDRSLFPICSGLFKKLSYVTNMQLVRPSFSSSACNSCVQLINAVYRLLKQCTELSSICRMKNTGVRQLIN